MINARYQQTEPAVLIATTALVTYVGQRALRRLIYGEGFVPNVRRGLLASLRNLPIVRNYVHEQLDKIAVDVERSLNKCYAHCTFVLELPDKGWTPETILERMAENDSLSHVEWKKGVVSGAIYTEHDPKLEGLMVSVYERHLRSNPLHSDVFVGVRKMESEVIRWCCNLFHGGPESCGSMTSGGTESLILACKAHRDRGYFEKGIVYPEMVIPATAHAGFDKAGEYLRIKVIHVPVDPKTMKVDIHKMKAAITRNTVMLVGSSPQFPHGSIDPILEIAELGLRYGIPVHVDACLGGFLVPFMDDAGFPLPPFDFRLEGVTSISADTHKVFLFGLAGTHCATDVSTAYTCHMDSPKMGPCIARNCYPVIELAPPPSHHVTSSASPIKVGIQNFSFSGTGGPGANMWPKTPFFRIVQVFLFGLAGTHCATDVSTAYTCRMNSPKMGPCIARNCYPVIELAPPPSHHVTSSASPIKVGIQNFSFSGHGGPGANMWPKTPFFRIVQYGYTPKGSSMVMYRNHKYHHYQFSVATDWPGGVYATPTVSGSRPGSVAACTWASLLYYGRDGYIEATRKIISTTRKIVNELRTVPGIQLLGSPDVSVVAVGSEEFDVFQLMDQLTSRGWNLNPLQYPSGFHLCVTLLHVAENVADRFVSDIRECTAEIMQSPRLPSTGKAAIYGMAQSIPDRSVIEELAHAYIDACYSTRYLPPPS
ncbi:sphingosine-1-phosphate lyase isoform X3 [Rhipicephalus microplus]